MLPLFKKDKQLQEMQFWKLVNRQNNQATLICERDEGDVAYTKEITFTDFPFDNVKVPKLWVAPTSLDGATTIQVIYLPSEH
jgi:hypothetical protein